MNCSEIQIIGPSEDRISKILNLFENQLKLLLASSSESPQREDLITQLLAAQTEVIQDLSATHIILPRTEDFNDN